MMPMLKKWLPYTVCSFIAIYLGVTMALMTTAAALVFRASLIDNEIRKKHEHPPGYYR